MDANEFGNELEKMRPELRAYLCRLVIRPQVAEDITQTTFLKALEDVAVPREDGNRLRAWLFRVATNLAFDELRRHSSWREQVMVDLRQQAERDPDFVRRSQTLTGTPETKSIAREHLTACFACTLRNLPERKAAALLLKEVYGFSIGEMSDILEASAGQVKNWLQESRAFMSERYSSTCALITKNGVCHQCVELDGYFDAKQGDPLANSSGNVDARLDILKKFKDKPWGTWHRFMFDLLDQM
jgi:RNA polymerase sigma-70 factor, ECF subfamily